MLVRNLRECKEFIAADGTVLREFLHPSKEDLEIRYSLARAVVKPGGSSTPHKLKTSEVYYVTRGHALMHIDDSSKKVGPDDVVYIPPGSTQHIENTGDTDLTFICIVDPAWHPQDEEIL